MVVISIAMLCATILGLAIVFGDDNPTDAGGGATQLETPTPTVVFIDGFYYLRWKEIENADGYAVSFLMHGCCCHNNEWINNWYPISPIDKERDLENGRLMRGLGNNNDYLYFHITPFIFQSVQPFGPTWVNLRFKIQAVPAPESSLTTSNIGQVEYLPGQVMRQFTVTNVRIENGFVTWDEYSKHSEIINAVSGSVLAWAQITVDGVMGWYLGASIDRDMSNIMQRDFNYAPGNIDQFRTVEISVRMLATLPWMWQSSPINPPVQARNESPLFSPSVWLCNTIPNRLLWNIINGAIGYRLYIQTSDDEWTVLANNITDLYFELNEDALRAQFGAGTHLFRMIAIADPSHGYIFDSHPGPPATFIVSTQPPTGDGFNWIPFILGGIAILLAALFLLLLTKQRRKEQALHE